MTIQFKRSKVANRVPTLSDLKVGEIAINLADKKIYSTDGVTIIPLGSNQEETDARYLKLTGGVLSGALTTTDLTASGKLLLGSGSYKQVLIDPTALPSGGHGELQITPQAVPSSGVSTFTTVFKERVVGAGTTSHNVRIDGTLIVEKNKKVFHQGFMGAGSGLDADLFDGKDSASYIRTTEHVQTIGYNDNSTANRVLAIDGYNSPVIGFMASEDNGSSGAFYGYNGANDRAEFTVRDTNMNKLVSVTPRGTGVTDFLIAPTIWGQKIWTAGNDGAGSGLDADLFDGQHSANFVNVVNDQNIAGIKTFSNDLIVRSLYPGISLVETEIPNTPIWSLKADGGNLTIRLNNTGVYPLTIVTNPTNDAITQIQLNAPVTIQGQTAWYAGNDGSGSGLDADLLDGKHGAAYGVLANTQSWTGDNTFTSVNATDIVATNGIRIDGTQSTPLSLKRASQVSMSFQAGVSIKYLGLDTNGILKYGNTADLTSNGNTVWHSGNMGAGSTLDADLLDGKDGTFYLNATNFNTGTMAKERLPAQITSSTTGNAGTATKLQTARKITMTGVVSGEGTFDGSANAMIATTLAPNAVTIASVEGLQAALDAKIETVPTKSADSDLLDGIDSTGFMRQSRGTVADLNLTTDRGQWFFSNTATNRPTDYGTLINYCSTGDYNGTNNWLTQMVFGTDGKLYTRAKVNSGGYTTWETHYTTLNKPSAADVSALATTTPYLGLDLNGNSDHPRFVSYNNPGKSTWIRVNATSTGILPYSHGNSYIGASGWSFKEMHSLKFIGDLDGNAETSTKLATPRTFALTGDITGTATFDGSANLSIATTVTADSHSHTQLIGNNYVSGGHELPKFFGSGKLRFQMLGASLPANGGIPGSSYSDAVWVSSYTGGDVKRSNVLLMSKGGPAKIGFRQQDWDSGTWGAYNDIYHTGNKPTITEIGAAAVDHTHAYLPVAGKAVDADKLDGQDGLYYLNAANLTGTINNDRMVPGSVIDRSISLGAADNLNTFTTPGFYYQLANSNATVANNYPMAHAGALMVQTTSSGVSQTYKTYSPDTPEIFFRTVYSGKWSKWRQVLHGDSTLNADTAVKLATARTINGVSFDGTTNITVADSTKVAKTGDTMTGMLAVKGSPMGLNLETTGDWSYIQLKSGASFAHIAKNINAVDGGAAGSLHLRPNGGANGSLVLQPDGPMLMQTSYGNITIGAENNGHCHYSTDRSNHWFNKEVRVQGEIMAGPGYNMRVFHQGFKPTADEIGALSASLMSLGSTASIGNLNFIAQNYTLGKCLYPDIDFAGGINSVSPYNNSGTGVTLTRVADALAPNASHQVIKIAHIPANGAAPGYGGFVTNMTASANTIFVQVFTAKLPADRQFATAENSMGTGSNTYWVTSNAGTGKWEKYIRVTICGAAGSFSSGGHVYVIGGPATPFDTYLADCTVYDMTALAAPYNKYNTPNLSEIGAAPASHTHPWANITGAPVYTSRWPNAAEAGAAPASHTHPWANITGAPVYTSRWPTAAEVGSYTKAEIDGRARLTGNDSIVWYGTTGIQYANFSGAGGAGTNGVQLNNPTGDWWHHIVLNHANAQGYYTDIATCFHSDSIRFKRVAGGGHTPWQELYHTGNKPTIADIGAAAASHTHAYLPLSGGNLTGTLNANHVVATGVGNDYAAGAFEAVGNGAPNTVFPTYGFHQPGKYAGSIQMRNGTEVSLWQQGGGALADLIPRYIRASNYGHGLVGTYSAERFQNVFSMGDAYKCDENGVTLADGYGIYWTHSNNTNAEGRKISGHHAVFTTAGKTKSAIGEHIWTTGSLFAGGASAANGSATTGGVYAANYFGSGNVGGTGQAIHCPNGIYASGGMAWLYGGITTSGTAINAGAGVITAGLVNANGGLSQNGNVILNGSDTWLRTTGATGWYSASYGGGIYMEDAVWVRIYGGKKFYVANTENDSIQTSGGIVAAQNVTAYSDRRVKDNIKNIPNALAKVMQLNGVTYTRTDQYDKEKLHTGVIAQEVEAVLPEAVVTLENGDIKDFKAVAYGNLVGLLIEAIKEQQAAILDLKQEINDLKAR